MAEEDKKTTPPQGDPTPMGMMFSQITDVRVDLKKVTKQVNVMAGQQGLMNKIVWLMFALYLTAAATGILDYFIGVLTK